LPIKLEGSTLFNSTLFTSKTATYVLYLHRPAQPDISETNDVITRQVSAKTSQLALLWIESDVPLQTIFMTDVYQLLKAIAATSQ